MAPVVAAQRWTEAQPRACGARRRSDVYILWRFSGLLCNYMVAFLCAQGLCWPPIMATAARSNAAVPPRLRGWQDTHAHFSSRLKRCETAALLSFNSYSIHCVPVGAWGASGGHAKRENLGTVRGSVCVGAAEARRTAASACHHYTTTTTASQPSSRYSAPASPASGSWSPAIQQFVPKHGTLEVREQRGAHDAGNWQLADVLNGPAAAQNSPIGSGVMCTSVARVGARIHSTRQQQGSAVAWYQ